MAILADSGSLGKALHFWGGALQEFLDISLMITSLPETKLAQKQPCIFILKWSQQWKLDSALKATGTDADFLFFFFFFYADFLLLPQLVGTEKEVFRGINVFYRQALFFLQIRLKEPR